MTDEEDLAARVLEISGGKGARLVFDPVAGPTLETLAKLTAHGGTIFEYGALATEPTPYPLFAALSRALSVQGYTLFEVVLDPELLAKAKSYVFDHIEAGNFKPKIAKTFPLAAIVEAHRYMASNSQVGKIVVTV